MWNRIAERIDVPPRDAIVMYMPGAEDLDLEVAKRHGFREQNMIGVERDKAVLANLRARNRLCVHGDFCEVVCAFNAAGRIDAVLGDLTCGLEPRVENSIETMQQLPHLERAVFMFNFMRGRDARSSSGRQAIDNTVKRFGGDERLLKNRAFHLLFGLSVRLLEARLSSDRVIKDFETEKWERYWSALNHDGMSYRSGDLVFDSAVWKNPLLALGFSLERKEREIFAKNSFAGQARRNLAAVMAHRTARLMS